MDAAAEDYFSTPAGQFIAGAHRYISAARILRYSDEAQSCGRMLQTPVLHLLAHGIELLLKFPLLQAGAAQREVAITYGHDLRKLWLSDANHALRAAVLEEAAVVWERARDSGIWSNDDFSDDAKRVLTRAVADLGRLHGKESSFALRYTLADRTSAPRPAFLIDVFGEVAERMVMNPRWLET